MKRKTYTNFMENLNKYRSPFGDIHQTINIRGGIEKRIENFFALMPKETFIKMYF